MNTIDKLFTKVTKIEGGCWEWRGYVGSNGYGQSSLRGRDRTHRIFYRHYKGTIPFGTEIDHLCRNKSCVNPEHLEAVPHRINAKRGHERKPYNHKGQSYRGQRN